MSKPKYIFNQNEEGTANILINGEIDGDWNIGLLEIADRITASKAEKIIVQVNSPGGSVTEGLAIASFIKGFPTNINTSGLGLVASIATTILLAGEEVSMSEGSFFMVHNPWSVAMGEADDLRETANLLDSMQNQLADIYVEAIKKNGKLINARTDSTKKQVLDWMNNETWFTAKEALAAGFIGKVTEGVQFLTQDNAKDIFNSCNKFNNVPTEFLNKVKAMADNNTSKETVEETGFFDKVKALFKSNPKEVKALIENLEEDEKAQSEEEIDAAIELLDSIGAFEEPFELLKSKGIFEETEEVEIEEEKEEEVIEEKASVEEDSEKAALQAEIQALKKENELKAKALQKIEEEKAAGPSAGDGGTANNKEDKSIQKLFAPTSAHKEALKAVGQLFN